MAKSCKLEVTRGPFGRPKVRGPAYEMYELPVGAEGKYGKITPYTSSWAKIAYRLISECVTLSNPRESGHEIEGSVSIKGKRYSAFTSGGDDGMIIVRTKGRKG